MAISARRGQMNLYHEYVWKSNLGKKITTIGFIIRVAQNYVLNFLNALLLTVEFMIHVYVDPLSPCIFGGFFFVSKRKNVSLHSMISMKLMSILDASKMIWHIKYCIRFEQVLRLKTKLSTKNFNWFCMNPFMNVFAIAHW